MDEHAYGAMRASLHPGQLWETLRSPAIICALRSRSKTSYDRRELGTFIFWASAVAHLPMEHRLSNLVVFVLLVINVKLILNVIDVFFIIVSLHPWASYSLPPAGLEFRLVHPLTCNILEAYTWLLIFHEIFRIYVGFGKI